MGKQTIVVYRHRWEEFSLVAVLVIDQGVTKEQISQYVYSKFSDVAWEVVDSYFPTVKQISALVD